MSKTFRTEFVSNGFAAHVLKRQRSQNCTIFLVRYRRGEYNIVVSGNTMEKAKERFIEATSPKNIDKYRVKSTSTVLRRKVGISILWKKLLEIGLHLKKVRLTLERTATM